MEDQVLLHSKRLLQLFLPSDSEDEKLRMVRTVANLIKNDVKSLDTSKQIYPNSQDFSSIDNNISKLPDSLYLLLNSLFSEKKADTKIASIGQAIIQERRPRVILALLQIGLAVKMHQQFASRFLIDTLHIQGFCASSYRGEEV
ncbi:hypothetical protein SNE40_014399 [Patella caerulea]|uniref:Uncharacterized protein n=1 Tax=Patella caerulea TaxID=87958 RepID=A0AAN8JFK2_PATCE